MRKFSTYFPNGLRAVLLFSGIGLLISLLVAFCSERGLWP
jgi:hypothetical protein